MPRVTRVGPRTVKPCEPRQVRKEAAAAGALRVADSSGPGDRFIWDRKRTVSLFPGSGFAGEESKLSSFLSRHSSVQ